MTRPCHKCGESDPSQFYKSIKKWCKLCWAAKVRENRLARIDQYLAYDRSRAFREDRVTARKAYQQAMKGDPDATRKHAESIRAYRIRCRERYKAHNAVNNALRTGVLTKEPCVECGATDLVHGHHDDYSKPLEVIWLCPEHHGKRHRWLNEQKRLKNAA